MSDQPAATAAAAPRAMLTRGDWIILALATVSLVLLGVTGWPRLDRSPKRPIPFTPASAFFLLGMMILLAPLGAGLARMLAGISVPEGSSPASLPLSDVAKLMLGGALARGLGVAAYVVMRRMARTPQPDRRASIPLATMVGVAGLALVWPLLLATVLVAGLVSGAPRDQVAHDTLRQLATAPLEGWTLALVLVVVVAGPIIEEVMYRGLLQQAIGRAGATAWQSITLASVIFTLAHLGVAQTHALVGLFVLSLGLGWAYERTGRLWAPIVMHMLFNAGNLIAARSI